MRAPLNGIVNALPFGTHTCRKQFLPLPTILSSRTSPRNGRSRHPTASNMGGIVARELVAG